jgi:predicted PurR-regulated permease PerM
MSEARQRAAVAYRAVLLAAGLLVLGLLFRQLVTLMVAVLMTVLIAIPLSAFATRLERRGVPRVVGAFVGLLGFLLSVAGLLALLIPPFVDQVEEFVDDVPGIVDDLGEDVHDLTGADSGEIGEQAQEFLQGFVDEPEKLIGPITSIGLGLAGVLGALLLMLVTAFFMAANPRPLENAALSLAPPDHRGRAREIAERLRASWIGWMQGLAVDMTVTGVLLYVGFTLIDLDFAVLFAVLAALLTVVPYYGAFASGLPAVLFALADSPGKAALTLGIYVVVQQFEANVTVPLVMARAVKLHPAVIAIGVIVVGQLFGAVGLIVSVPILTAIVILVDELWVKPMEARHANPPPAVGPAGSAGAAKPVQQQPGAEAGGGVRV